MKTIYSLWHTLHAEGIINVNIYTLTCLNIGTPKNNNFPFETNGKLMILGVPRLKCIRVKSGNQTHLISNSKDR